MYPSHFRVCFSTRLGQTMVVRFGGHRFRSDVQFNNNLSEVNGGGLSVFDGDVT